MQNKENDEVDAEESEDPVFPDDRDFIIQETLNGICTDFVNDCSKDQTPEKR